MGEGGGDGQGKTPWISHRCNVVGWNVTLSFGFDVTSVPPISICVVDHNHQLILLEAQIVLRTACSGVGARVIEDFSVVLCVCLHVNMKDASECVESYVMLCYVWSGRLLINVLDW